MGWNNPPIPWSEFEKKLSDASRPGSAPPVGADGGDSPGWSLKRKAYQAPDMVRSSGAVVPYAELHAHSSFSFLDGASMPESLAEEAARLGLHALALTDHDGLYGIVRMAEAAAEIGQTATVFGAELSLGLRGPQNGVPDPEGIHLLVLARKEEGYHRLAAAITKAQLRGGEKGRPVYDLEELAEQAGGHWLILTGCRKGTVRRALESGSGGVSRPSGRIETQAAKLWPGTPVVPTMSTGATDSIFLTANGIPSFGVSGLFADASGNGVHGLNERIRVKSLYDGRDFLYALVKDYARLP